MSGTGDIYEYQHELTRRLEAALAEIEEAKRALGLAWLSGDVSLADGIRAKTAALEGLMHEALARR